MKLRASLELWRDAGQEQRQVAVLRDEDDDGALVAWNAYTPQRVEDLAMLARAANELESMRERLERLEDAEATIAKIGFCDPAPHEARERYERKYGSLRGVEHVTVKPKRQDA
jgi:hypothetical protein